MTAHYDRAVLLFEQSRFDLAEQELRQSLSDEPGDSRAHALLAMCLCGRKDYETATLQAEEAIHLDPEVPLGYFALSSVLYQRGRLPEAEAAIEQALERAPWDADYYSQLASIRFEQRRWPAALEAAEEGLRLDAEHIGCTNLRAMSLVKLGRRAEAGAALGDALRREPEDALTHANQGWTLLEQRQPDKAVEHFREALRLEPDMEWARQGIIEALKARHWLYRQMLGYFLWMQRLGGRARWGVIIGLLLAQRVLASDAPGPLAPLGTILFCGLLAFMFLTWTADPLFNLLLRFNRLGRLALSRQQIWASNCVAACLLLALVFLACWGDTGEILYSLAALMAAWLVLPVAGTFKTSAGWPRQLMILYTILLIAMAAGGMSILFFGEHLPRDTWGIALAMAKVLSVGFFFGAAASTWLVNLLPLVASKRG